MIALNDVLETPIYTIARCLNEIIVNDNLESAFQKIVNWLAGSLDIDCCYIVENDNSTGNKAIFSGGVANLSGNNIIQTKLFTEVHRVLADNRCFKISHNNRVSEDLHQWLKQSNLKSLLLIPVFRGNRFWGSIGFGDAKSNSTWNNSEIQLQSLALAIGSALEAHGNKTEIAQGNEVVNAALSALDEIVWELDLLTNTTKVGGSPEFIKSLRKSGG